MAWGEGVFAPLEDDEMVVTFLQAVPISEAEYQHVVDNGAGSLEDLFVEAQIDVYDLDRPSVV